MSDSNLEDYPEVIQKLEKIAFEKAKKQMLEMLEGDKASTELIKKIVIEDMRGSDEHTV